MTLTWRFVGHLNESKQHVISEVCVEYPGIHRETVTRYNQSGAPVKNSARTYYFVDKPYDPCEYTTFAAALAALQVTKS
jgi:hypothetical protein